MGAASPFPRDSLGANRLSPTTAEFNEARRAHLDFVNTSPPTQAADGFNPIPHPHLTLGGTVRVHVDGDTRIDWGSHITSGLAHSEFPPNTGYRGA